MVFICFFFLLFFFFFTLFAAHMFPFVLIFIYSFIIIAEEIIDAKNDLFSGESKKAFVRSSCFHSL